MRLLQMNLHGLTHMWLYMYAYSLYLFFDFAGYSLFAIAVSYLYGIKTPPNFNQPFKAKILKISEQMAYDFIVLV